MAYGSRVRLFEGHAGQDSINLGAGWWKMGLSWSEFLFQPLIFIASQHVVSTHCYCNGSIQWLGAALPGPVSCMAYFTLWAIRK